MPVIDTSALEVIERLPGWYGRYFDSPSMTFAHYDFKRGSSIHEHLRFDGTRAPPICSPTIIRVSVNAGWQAICRAVPETRERCACSEQNFSVFELNWSVDP